VQAAKAAGMAALAVARLDDEALLAAAGADLVVTSCDEVEEDPLRIGRGFHDRREPPVVVEGIVHDRPDGRRTGALQPPAEALIDAGEFVAFDDALRLVLAARSRGLRLADRFMERIPLELAALLPERPVPALSATTRLCDAFEVNVCGEDLPQSKPHPEIFLMAARNLRVPPDACVVVEDATSGHTLSWASWPRTFVAGLFDTPNTEPPVPALVPVPDWVRIRVLLDDLPMTLRSGELVEHSRTLDMRCGALFTVWHQRDSRGRLLRLRSMRMVSVAERALGAQLVELSIDDAPAEVTLDATLEMTSSGLELIRSDDDVAVWQTSGGNKFLAMTSAGEVRVQGRVLPPLVDQQLRRAWRWTSAPGQTAVFRRLVGIERGREDGRELGSRVRHALARATASGWRRVLEAHECAWAERWACSDIEIEGDENAAACFALRDLPSEQRRQSR
jgi:beta-phosphoglucomutase-like phosphatase (HAD superfamily)